MIVTCGEALVDLVPQERDGEVLYRPVLGGSLFTVALGIARLGGQAGYVWELSYDSLGERFRKALQDAGVDASAVKRSARATPVAVVDLSGEEARYAIADPDGVMVDTTPNELPPEAGCLLVGSAVLAREPVADAIEALATDAPALAIDYNVRPPSIKDPDAYRARLDRLSRRAAVVKASAADLAALGIADAAAHMRRLAREGSSLAILTLADQGAMAFSRDAEVASASEARTIVDTVGAGDAFMAALLYHLSAEGHLANRRCARLDAHDLAKTLRFCQVAAAWTCAAEGATMPSLADLMGHSA